MVCCVVLGWFCRLCSHRPRCRPSPPLSRQQLVRQQRAGAEGGQRGGRGPARGPCRGVLEHGEDAHRRRGQDDLLHQGDRAVDLGGVTLLLDGGTVNDIR